MIHSIMDLNYPDQRYDAIQVGRLILTFPACTVPKLSAVSSDYIRRAETDGTTLEGHEKTEPSLLLLLA